MRLNKRESAIENSNDNYADMAPLSGIIHKSDLSNFASRKIQRQEVFSINQKRQMDATALGN